MMKKCICLFTFLLIFAVFLPGCKQKEDAQGQLETVTIKLGHVGHDHHAALFVALDNASEYAKESQIDSMSCTIMAERLPTLKS